MVANEDQPGTAPQKRQVRIVVKRRCFGDKARGGREVAGEIVVLQQLDGYIRFCGDRPGLVQQQRDTRHAFLQHWKIGSVRNNRSRTAIHGSRPLNVENSMLQDSTIPVAARIWPMSSCWAENC